MPKRQPSVYQLFTKNEEETRMFNIGQTCPFKNKILYKGDIIIDIKWPCDCGELIRLSDILFHRFHACVLQ